VKSGGIGRLWTREDFSYFLVGQGWVGIRIRVRVMVSE